MNGEPLPAAQSTPQSFPIAGIGASAGGLEAISQHLRSLPADTGIGFVIVQHLVPQYDSMLMDLLARATPMSVVEVTSGRAVEPNHVYVIPPNADLEILHGVLKLSPRTLGAGLHLPIDQFLTSLAEDSKAKAVGIILSGSASDGTLGLKAVKAAGGITFAQDEATARYGSMPHHAIASGYVDFVLSPEKIAQELTRITRHPYVAREFVLDTEDAGTLSEKELSDTFTVLKNATGVSDLFGLVDKKNKIYFKKPTPVRTRLDFGVNERFSAIPDSRVRIAQRIARDFDPQKEANRLLLSDYTPAGLLLNSNLEIIHFHGHTGPYLDPVPGAASLRLLKMAREGLPLELRAAIQKVEEEGKPVIKTGIQVHSGDSVREITIEVRPLASPAGDRYFLVLFREGAEPSPTDSVTDSRQDRETMGLKSELEQVNAQLQEIIEQNEENEQELRAANEEVQSTNEELQSSNEELETAKEELQATNEELTTLNEELQNRNLELGRANNDLANVIDNVTISMLILGSDLRIRRFTPGAEDILSLIPADVGRPITDLRSALDFEGLGEMVSEAIRTETVKARDVRDHHNRWHSLRVRPYRTVEGNLDGAVIALIDIHELKSEVTESHRYAEAIGATIRESTLVLDMDLRVKAVNEAFLAAFHVSREETEDRRINELGDGA